MKYFLGIDGGGTKTKAIAIDQDNNQIGEITLNASSIDTVPLTQTIHVLQSIINHPTLSNIKEFESIFIGLGGVVFESQIQQIIAFIKDERKLKSSIIVIKNDMYNALYSGLIFNEGMCLICGTGMVAFGVNQDGLSHKSGGWGYKEGELGSSFHLGKEAIRYMIRCFDHRLPKDQLAIEIAAEISLRTANDIVDIMDQLYLDRTKIASLAPLITKYANMGHLYAEKIVDRATDELLLSIIAVYRTLKLNETKLVITGSLGNSEGYFKEQLHQKIHDYSNKIEIIEPLIDPAFAAALMAKQLIK